MFTSKDGEPVNEERWQWKVIYKDGSELYQFDYEKQKYHYFAEIDQEQVAQFGMVNIERDSDVMLEIPDGSPIFHYYDNLVQQPLGGEQTVHRLYVFGFDLGTDKIIYSILPNNFLIKGTVSGIL